MLVSLCRLGLNLAFARVQPPAERLAPWRLASLAGVAVAGFIWGLAEWLYFENPQILPRLLLIFILAGLNAGAARSLAAVPWSYRTHVVATLAPLLARFATVEEPGGWTLALITVTFAMFLLKTAKLHSADLLRLLRLIFENEELGPHAPRGKGPAAAANQAKRDFLATMSTRNPHADERHLGQAASPRTLAAESHPEERGRNRFQVHTLMRLLNDILDFSKIESGNLDLESVTFALPQTVADVAALLHARAVA